MSVVECGKKRALKFSLNEVEVGSSLLIAIGVVEALHVAGRCFSHGATRNSTGSQFLKFNVQKNQLDF